MHDCWPSLCSWMCKCMFLSFEFRYTRVVRAEVMLIMGWGVVLLIVLGQPGQPGQPRSAAVRTLGRLSASCDHLEDGPEPRARMLLR